MNRLLILAAKGESDPWFWLLMAGLLALSPGSAAVKYLLRKRRGSRTLMDATTLGLQPIDAPATLLQSIAALPLCARSDRREVRHAMRGPYRGHDLVVFEFEYRIGNIKNTREYAQTVVMFEPVQSAIKSLAITPLSQAPRSMKSDSLSILADQAEVSRTHAVAGEPIDAVQRLIGSLGPILAANRNLCIESGGGKLLVYINHATRSGSELAALLDLSCAIHDQLESRG